MTHVIHAEPKQDHVTIYHNEDGTFFMYGHSGITISPEEAENLAAYLIKNLK